MCRGIIQENRPFGRLVSSCDPNEKKFELFHSFPQGDCLAYANALKHNIEGDLLILIRIETGLSGVKKLCLRGPHSPNPVPTRY